MSPKITILYSLPKSLYICINLLGFKKGLKLPIWVHYKTKIISLKGKVNLTKLTFGAVRIGFESVGLYDIKRSISIISIDGEVTFLGKATFGQGTRLIVNRKGILEIGNNFCSTAELKMVCYNRITVAENALLAWEVVVMDTNFHIAQYENEQYTPYTKPVFLGRNCWIGLRAIILAGTSIPDGSIVGAGSLCNKDYKESRTLIAGSPAIVRKRNIERVSQQFEQQIVDQYNSSQTSNGEQ